MSCKVTFTDNSPEIMAAFNQQCENALTKIGMLGRDAAKKNCNFPGSSGDLRNSMEHTVVGDTAYFGTNSEYSVYVEYGTGRFCTLGGGRDTPWRYQDVKGNWYTTTGAPARPYLKPAAEENADTFKQIIEECLKG